MTPRPAMETLPFFFSAPGLSAPSSCWSISSRSFHHWRPPSFIRIWSYCPSIVESLLWASLNFTFLFLSSTLSPVVVVVVVLCCVHLPVIESYRSTCKMMGLQHCDFHHCRCRHTIDDQTTGTMVEDLYSNGGKEGDSIGRAPFVPHFIGQVHIDVALHSSLWCDHHVIMGASNRSFQLLLHLVWWLPIDRYIYTHMCMCCHLLTIHIQQYGDVRQSPPSI